MEQLVHGLRPQPHLGPLERFGGLQRRGGEHVVDVLADHRRLDDRMTVVDKRWNHRLRVELDIGGVELIALEDIDVVALPLEPLLGQSEANFRRTYRRAVMIELQHDTSASKLCRDASRVTAAE